MSAPFVWILVCSVAGIIGSRLFVIPFWAPYVCLLIAAFGFFARFRLALAGHFLLICMLAACLTQRREQLYDHNELRVWVHKNARQVSAFQGVVQKTPEIGPDYFVIQLEIKSISGKPVKGVARITVSGPMDPRLHAGDSIESFARFRMPRNFRTDGAFDYEGFLRKENIHVLGSIKRAGLIHITGGSSSLRRLASIVRLDGIFKISSTFNGRDAGVLRALWLDDRGGMSQQSQQELIDAGVFHVIAISGFHFTVLIFLLFFLLKRTISFRMSVFAACLFLGIYFLVLEGRSSVTRSFLSFLIYALAVWRHDRVSLANWISISAWIQLVINPLEIYDAGFQLTYLSTAVILFLIVPISRRFTSLTKLIQVPLNLLVSGIVLQLVLLPYLLFNFHRISLYSVPANLIAVPLSSLLIALGVIFLPFTGPTRLLAVPIQALITLLHRGSALFSDCGVLVLPSPPEWLVLLFYFLLLGFVIARSVRAKVVLLALCTLCGLSVFHRDARHISDTLRLHFLDVGQGDSIMIEYPDGNFDLVDGGGFFNSDALDTGQSIVIPYLCRKGVSRLNRVFLTHAHADHMMGLISVLKYISVNNLYVTRQPFGNRGYQYFVRSVQKTPTPVHAGTVFDEGEVRIKVLTPDDSRKSKRVANDDSLVLLLEYGTQRILLTGDAEAAEEMLLTSRIEGHVSLIKVPHHGSKTSSSEDLLKKTRPKVAIASLGYDNWFGHPDPRVVNRYRNLHAMFYRTDRDGTVVVTVSRREMAILTN